MDFEDVRREFERQRDTNHELRNLIGKCVPMDLYVLDMKEIEDELGTTKDIALMLKSRGETQAAVRGAVFGLGTKIIAAVVLTCTITTAVVTALAAINH